jgi:colicin import membrane protein
MRPLLIGLTWTISFKRGYMSENALTLIETAKPLDLFANNGLDQVIEKIEQEARSIVLDISTAQGRKDIASLAFKIAKSKTHLDNVGKELVSGWKEQAKKVDAERARSWVISDN